jgi:uroporphyrinogen decarboxylase
MFGIPRQAPRIDSFMTNAVFEREFLRAIEGDILLIATPHLCKSPLWAKNAEAMWKEQELWGQSFRIPVSEYFRSTEDGGIFWETTGALCPAGGYYFDRPQAADLFADFEYPDPDDYNPPDSFTDEFLRDLEEIAKTLYEETEYSLSMGETVTDLQFQPGGRIGWMVLLKENPELMKAYLAKAVDAGLKQIALLEQAIGKYADMLLTADDMGDNRGVIVGDDLWRDVYKPFYKKLYQGWHERTQMKICLHCCGAVSSILGDLIECGLDIYNPVQISGSNMNPAGLKEQFGDTLVFYGGDYDAQLMKGRGYEEVYDHVKNNLCVFKQKGGHIFAGVHNLPPDMPEDHLRAFFNAWRDHRDY